MSAPPAKAANIIDRLIDILGRADALTQDAFDRLSMLVDEAQTVANETAEIRAELDVFLEQYAPESGLADGASGQIRFAGVLIDREVMRADTAAIALNASKATVLLASLKSLQTSLGSAARHFKLDSALTSTLDARDEAIQAALAAAREDERRKLSREIHDGPAQVLANAVFHVQTTEQVVKRNPLLIEEELIRLRDVLKEGVTEVRRFMFGLRPATLEAYGLGPTLQRYVEDWGRFYGHRTTISVMPNLPRLTPDQDLTIFRIIQEALQNIHKHAGNDASVEIVLATERNRVVVRISDDGVGFDPALVAPKLTSGAGLLGMRERASLIHAAFVIESHLGSGSVITLSFPFVAQDDLGMAVQA